MSRKIALVIILVGLVATITNITGNIIATILTDKWKSNANIVLPVFIGSTAIGIMFTVWQNALQNRTDKAIKGQNKGKGKAKVPQVVTQEKKREYRVLGVPIWSVREFEEKREYRIFGIPIWLWLPSASSIHILTTIGTVSGILLGSMSLVVSVPVTQSQNQDVEPTQAQHDTSHNTSSAATPIATANPSHTSMSTLATSACQQSREGETSEEREAYILLAEACYWPEQFRYSFDEDSQGWYTGDYDDPFGFAKTSITSDGKYRWEVTSKEVATWWINPPAPVDEPVGDFYATVEMLKLPGSSEGSQYGLLARSPDDGNFYHFRVRPNGQLFSAIDLAPSFNRAMPNMESRQSSAIKENESNKLTLIGRGPAFYYFVNEQFVAKTVDDRLERGKVTMAVYFPTEEGEQATFEFDNFELRVPPP